MRMAPPEALDRGYRDDEVEVISRWWNGLSTSTRQQLKNEFEDRAGWPAREAFAARSIDVAFVCPLGRATCPMRRIVERAVALENEVNA